MAIPSFSLSGFTIKQKILIIPAALLAIYISTPFAVVPTGSRGIITTFGKATDIAFDPGIHFKFPFVQSMNLMNIQIQNGEGEGDAASKDLQSIHTRVAVNYHLDPSRQST